MNARSSLARPRSRVALPGGLAEARSLLGTASAQGWATEMLDADVTPIAARAGHAHTTSPSPARSNASNRVALRLAPFGDEFRVWRSRPADADLRASRRVAIDGVPR